MSDIDEKKPAGKAGKRKRNAEQRNRKSDQKQRPKADELRSAKAQIDAVLLASADTASIEAKAAQEQADTTIAAPEPLPTAVADVAVQPTAPMTSAEMAPVGAQDASEQSAVEITSIETAPSTAPDLKEQTFASTPTEVAPVSAAAPTAVAPVSLQTIANAYGDYTRKSLEQTRCFFDKLTGVRSLDKAIEVQTEFAKQAYETFIAEARKINDLHRELARQRLERLEGFVTKATQTSRTI